jgi:hypothetical protein
MLIAILVLLGIAGAIWYFASKQTHVPVTLTKEDVAVPTQEQRDEALKQAQLDALAALAKSKPSPSVEQINATLDALSTEAPKPPKKKRRYYPKKK